MERLLTKCCWANRQSENDENGIPLKIYCESCEGQDPHMDWVEMCEHCERPGVYCECP